jgi:hypothetical protein
MKHSSSRDDSGRCGKPGIEFTETEEGRMWYCAEHWDAQLEYFGAFGLVRNGRLWYDKVK